MSQAINVTINYCIESDKKVYEIIQKIVENLTRQDAHINELRVDYLGE